MEYIPAKTIVTRTKSTAWFGTDYNMNIYRGCCHGCIYCDSRSDCYRVENFDDVKAKENALEIIRNDLRRKVQKGVVGTGSMSDPYNPFEKQMRLTRNALELINAYGFGIAIATKSDLMLRDIDILSDIKQHSPVILKITVTTADDEMCRKIEPNVAVSSQRFAMIKQLSETGLFAGVLLMPVLPFLEDTEENILEVVRKAHESGAKFIYAGFGVTLRDNQREHFYGKLDELYPDLKHKYIKQYGNRYSCGSPKAKQLWSVFTAECGRLGLLYNMKDIVRLYKTGYEYSQISFL